MKRFTFLLLVSLIIHSTNYATTLSPSTFTVSKLNSISSGTTVYLQAGTYNLNQNLINAWKGGNRNNVTFKRTGSGTVIMNGNGFSKLVTLDFKNKDKLRLENIKFVNIRPQFYACTNSSMYGLTVEGQKSSSSNGAENNVLEIYACTNCVVENCTVRWTYTGENGKGIKIWKGKNITMKNNTIRGRIRGGYDAYSGPNEPKINLLITGGTITREVSSGTEDHGIYAHDLSGLTVTGVTISKFTNTSSGGSLKLKNIDDVEVKNCNFSTSGILLRVETKTWNHLANIWIHDNVITNSGNAIESYTRGGAPKAIVIEKNCLSAGKISISTNNSNLSEWSNYCARAGKNGGVFNNGTANTNSIPSGIKNSGNYISTSCGSSNTPIDKTIWLKNKGKYVNLDPKNSLYPLFANSTENKWSTTKFKVVDAGNGKIALKSLNNGKYLRANDMNSKYSITATNSAIYSTSKFTWEEVATNVVALKAFSGKYVQASQNASNKPLEASGTKIWSTAKFTWGTITKSASIKKMADSHTKMYPNPFTNESASIKQIADRNTRMYPNPFTSELIIESDKTYKKMMLFDMSGKMIDTWELGNGSEIHYAPSYDKVPCGLYIIKLISNDDIKTQKLLRR